MKNISYIVSNKKIDQNLHHRKSILVVLTHIKSIKDAYFAFYILVILYLYR